jgi:selenide,water dikinase
MGITKVDTILMILGASLKMTEQERDVCNSLMIKGFNEVAQAAGTSITGGQTIFNPWVMIGGTAMSVLREEQIIRPNNMKAGEVLILTKPLGTQLVVNFNQWLKLKNDKWKKVEPFVSAEKVLEAYDKGVVAMSTLNLAGAQLMQKYKASAGTDVTGFGIKGHSQNLARAQKEKVDLIINKFPTLGGLHKYDKIARDFKFKQGKAAETSGGLLISLAKEKAQDFIGEYKELSGLDAFVVGEVVKGENNSIIVDELEFIDV